MCIGIGEGSHQGYVSVCSMCELEKERVAIKDMSVFEALIGIGVSVAIKDMSVFEAWIGIGE